MSSPYVAACDVCGGPIHEAGDAVVRGEQGPTPGDEHGGVTYAHTWCDGEA